MDLIKLIGFLFEATKQSKYTILRLKDFRWILFENKPIIYRREDEFAV